MSLTKLELTLYFSVVHNPLMDLFFASFSKGVCIYYHYVLPHNITSPPHPLFLCRVHMCLKCIRKFFKPKAQGAGKSANTKLFLFSLSILKFFNNKMNITLSGCLSVLLYHCYACLSFTFLCEFDAALKFCGSLSNRFDLKCFSSESALQVNLSYCDPSPRVKNGLA